MEKGLRLDRVTALDINRGVQPNYAAVVAPLKRVASTEKQQAIRLQIVCSLTATRYVIQKQPK